MAALATMCSTFLFVAVFMFASADQKPITAESGKNVNLTCKAPNHNRINIVEWSRADLEPEHVFVFRNGKFDPDNQNLFFKNRVKLQDSQMKDGNVSLVLQNVTTNDSGTYECRVSVEQGVPPEPISIITLSVVDPPPGPSGGDTEDGGKQVGVSSGHPGLIVSLSVPAVLIGAAFVLF